MKTRNLMLVGLGFALTLGLSACGKSDDASQSASAASAAVAPVASVAVEASAPAAAPAAAAASEPPSGTVPGEPGLSARRSIAKP